MTLIGGGGGGNCTHPNQSSHLMSLTSGWREINIAPFCSCRFCIYVVHSIQSKSYFVCLCVNSGISCSMLYSHLENLSLHIMPNKQLSIRCVLNHIWISLILSVHTSVCSTKMTSSPLFIVYMLLFQDVLEYALVPKDPDTSFFFLHPFTGNISLAKAFSFDTQTEYRVSSHHIANNLF